MKILNIQEAKTHLSRLVEEAVRGEEIVIAKAGKPLVKLTPWTREHAARKAGDWRGRLFIADDFDETDEDVIRLFEGSDGAPGKAAGKRYSKRSSKPRR